MYFLVAEFFFFIMWALLFATGSSFLALQAGAGYISPSLLAIRETNDGAGAGITHLTLSSDKQSYFAVIKTGEISFRVALDTASSDLWITSSTCSTNACKAVPRYPLTYESPTFASVNGNSTAFNVSYSDSTGVSGFVARESVLLANLTAENQVFGVVTQSNVSFVDQTSGILGLGFPRLSGISSSVTNSTPFFVGLAQQGLLDYPLFGLSLTRNSSGTLSLGAIDGSVVKNVSKIGWNKVVEFAPFRNESNVSTYLQWAIPLAAFSVNDTQLTPLPTYTNLGGNTSLAMFDIGTSGLYGPYQDVTRLFSLIGSARLVGDGQWAVPCDTVVSISFTFGSQNYTLQPSDYLIGPAVGNPNLCLSWPRALPPSSDGIDWQLGTPFLRTVYSIFSYGINTKEPPMLGLYPLQNTINSLETQDSISSFFSSISAAVATTLPNFPLSTPSFTTPSYALNSSISAPTGGIVSTALATSTYSAIFGKNTNLSAIPTITAAPTLATLIVTDSSGVVSTSISVEASVILGIPPGWLTGSACRTPMNTMLPLGLSLLVALFSVVPVID